MKYLWPLQRCAFLFLAFALLLSGCSQQAPKKVFYTWQGIGPDKWASIWLINHYIDPEADIRFTKVNGVVENAIAFDIPGSRYKRSSDQSTIASLMTDFGIHDPVAMDMAQIIYDIEVDFWGNNVHPRSSVVEDAFRGMQKHYGRDAVPDACYVAFFANLYRLLADQKTRALSADAFRKALLPYPHCARQSLAFVRRDTGKLVEEIHIRDLLQQIKQGKRVVFVDAREDDEFDEFRIPNAINIKLREVGPELAGLLGDADTVVTYCLKDFRGYELARALQTRAGIDNVAIMRPYGINGWRELGLPVEGSKALEHELALARLDDCLGDIDRCLKVN